MVQGTWAAALEHERPAGWPLGSWLAGVARNLVRRSRRDHARRQRREQAAARPELVPSAADVVAEEERHRRPVDAVLALREPYRTVVLLRYSDGLPPRRIAARLGLPGATVRSHAKCGLERGWWRSCRSAARGERSHLLES